jgi:hypothetical protein
VPSAHEGIGRFGKVPQNVCHHAGGFSRAERAGTDQVIHQVAMRKRSGHGAHHGRSAASSARILPDIGQDLRETKIE